MKNIKGNWRRTNPKFSKGKYIPEGLFVLMYKKKTGAMFVDYRYSSCPKSTHADVTHWMPLPKPPKK